MAKESKKWYVATVILHLVSFGVVAAGITISFGSICFLALTTSRETLVGSYIGKARADVDYSYSPSPNTNRPATRIAAQADPPSSAKLRILIPSTVRDLTTSDMQLEGFISYWNFETQLDQELGPAIRELQDALPIQFAPTEEISGAGLAATLTIAASMWPQSMKLESNYIFPSASAAIPPSAAATIPSPAAAVPPGIPLAAELAPPPAASETSPRRYHSLHAQVMRHFHKVRTTAQLNRAELARIHSGDLRPW